MSSSIRARKLLQASETGSCELFKKLNSHTNVLSSLFNIKDLLQVLDFQDPQEDRVFDRADGGSEGSEQDMPAVPADVLAPGLQGAHLHQRPGRADEHGGP